MSKPVLSAEWMREYAQLWNSTPATREGTAELTMVIEFRLSDDESRAARINIVNGEAVETGAPSPEHKPNYQMTATAADWKRLGDGDLDPTRALMSRKVKFRGSLMVAMNNLPALEEALRMFGRIDTDWSV